MGAPAANFGTTVNPASGSFLTTKPGVKPIILADSFISITYHNESNLPMFPLEQGAFQTYNKVATPYDITVRLAKSNTFGVTGLADLINGANSMKLFLATLESMLSDTNLYAIVTPDAIYNNANLKAFDYKREMNNGAGIILADLHFVEIVSAPVSSGTSAASQTSVAPNSTNTIPPSAAQTSTLGAVLAVTSTVAGAAATIALKH